MSHNNLEGEIPIQLYRLDQLTLIDLSHNYLSGNILSWMIFTHPFSDQNGYDSNQYFEFTTKNVTFLYKGSIIQYFTRIDFSCNNFTGEIPLKIGNLRKIKVLNPLAQQFDWANSINIFKIKGNRELGSFIQQIRRRNPSTYWTIFFSLFQCGTQ